MNQTGSHQSDFLFASPSFLEGAARIFDFGDAMSLNAYNQSSSPQAADERANRADWIAVGNDIRDAIEQVRSEIGAIMATSRG